MDEVNEHKPNVLLIMTDQQRWDSMGAARNPIVRTPNMDRLAREGVRCRNAFLSNPFCMPARASILTGRYAHGHRLWDNGVTLPEETITLAHCFGAAGYHTALIGKGHLTPYQQPGSPDAFATWRSPSQEDWHGPYYGFEEVRLVSGHNKPFGHYGAWLRREHPEALRCFEPGAAVKSGTGAPMSWKSSLPVELHASTWIGDQTIDFLRQNRSTPFFAWISFPDPHMPFCPPAPYHDAYSLDSVPMPLRCPGELDDKPPHFKAFWEGRVNGMGGRASPDLSQMTDDQIREIIAHTYGMVSLVDDNLGRIFAEMDRLGLFENTLVVFMSDHGELLGDHWLVGKGPFHYDSLVRIPLLFRFPNGEAHRPTVDAYLSNVDLAPTLVDYASLSELPDVHGRSVLPVLRGECEDLGRDRLLIEFEWRFIPDLRLKTIRTAHYKLTVYANQSYGELYDLDRDPSEFVNCWNDPTYAAIKHDLRAQLLDMLMESEGRLPDRLVPN